LRRAFAAAAGTAAGLVALLGYKSGPAPHRLVAAPRSIGPDVTVPPTTSTPGATPPAEQATPPAEQKVDGPVEDTRYGPVQVEVTIRGGKLVDVTALQLPSDRRRSEEISTEAAPILRQEALAAQGVSIDTVSGATYTSDGYAASLQAALDAARR
jgi:uncharacterized protein with FMN-binding domain